MSYITAQQTKLDLELVPKEKRLEIGKCNRRLNPGKIQREPTFQVVLDALALTPCYSIVLITTHMHQPWRTFAALINRSLSGKTTGLDKLCFSRAQILWGMYHQKNVDYVELLWEDFIYQIDNRAYKKQEKILLEKRDQDAHLQGRLSDKHFKICLCKRSNSNLTRLTSPEMKETKAYKTYLGYATGATPPKKVRKFKKLTSPQLTTIPVSPEEPTGKSKRVKRPAKKSTKAPTRGVVIRETPKMPLSKKKEKMTLEKHKEIDLLSEVALTKESQYEEVRQKSLRDFHKTHLSGSGTVTKTAPSAAKIKPFVINGSLVIFYVGKIEKLS
ncbi:hypothetical protein Tco_1141365 [Tanacetum coccineum]